ncbi:hypothetical protein EDI_340700 [Entamoeba dispar SAW760]|uniref:Uncharacterized protein n=1 Tax=Entamoeba dispar (strain ATCC PRA-260 / SAW760) TaxID=370354 RepID=B0EJD4_ENTDS|nr:uncharacterized protein EDI_340700 [Entamoeba dispar SAW760]EDR25371.1 hypothetical protein EDI_340700 [Entamoeba dispar SAW760]|eukprot:EDR25371.1 hypothetical protein EDI_340700 [Entamoeba dispar SAW760]
MVLLKIVNELYQFSMEFSNEETVGEIINLINTTLPKIMAIKKCQEIDIDPLIPPHLTEIKERVVSEAIKTIHNEFLDIPSLDVEIADLKRMYEIVMNKQPEAFINQLTTPCTYTKMICCKKELDNKKTFQSLYGPNNKLTLKVIIE